MKRDIRTPVKSTISCGACVYRINDDNTFDFLLVRPWKDRNAWGIPKGHLNDGEEHVACALREVMEETGIAVSLEEPLSPVMCSYRDEQKTVVSWLARQTCDKVPYPCDGENYQVSWFNSRELPNIHMYQRSLITQAVGLIEYKVSVEYTRKNLFDSLKMPDDLRVKSH